ncbi:DNA repair protein Rad4 [Oesophagostomum dentatum]|uniref:DNA repair protein Rad4 n=1 Tax=Oesophagostomum dentatum TaxID=61180 RepID=A0A0B1SPQ1_OESDE|nr:DNA repair protein Rad4 [Oesophagostomum dentatum]
MKAHHPTTRTTRVIVMRASLSLLPNDPKLLRRKEGMLVPHVDSLPRASSRKSPKTSTGRTKQLVTKPLKPWQRTEETVMEGDIVVPPRALRKGEKKMLQFRILAASLALGRKYEMSTEEGCKVMDEIRNQSVAVKKAVSSALGVPQEQKKDDDQSSSEDEWEEMEPLDVEEAAGKDVQVTLEKEEEKDWWALYLRQEVNKCVRENWENAHKVNILCCIAHLQYLRKIALEENLVPSLMLTVMPSGYQKLVGESISLENVSRIAKWYHSAFKPSMGTIKYDTGTCRFDATARLSEMVSQSVFENDADRAVLLFAIFVAMECVVRICYNIQAIPRKWDEKVIKEITAMKGKGAAASSLETKTEKQKTKEAKKKSSTSTAASDYRGMIRNYWVEYWDVKQKRWICVDPLRGSVDDPNSIEENLTKPITYVFAIDNEGGVREVTARYASEFLRPDFRRLRTDPRWLASTLRKKIIRPNSKRSELEDIHMRQELVNKPLPTTVAEYKNHPLYVLEKDLLKFEGIYPKPEDQKPLGEIRGHKVYPRSTVYTLQSANNWIKMARSVKEGEKPYKVVKARPNIRVPVEEREQRYLDVFGYWQTEPFRPPKVENDRIPRNEYGNVYMYQPSMCPIGAVHLRLPGLPSIARRLGGLECVPAVVGWDFNSCSNFPVIDGACVLEKDAQAFINEWKRLEATREERENKKREERVLGNWRKLIRGILRLHYVKKKFGATKEKARSRKKKAVEHKDTAGEPVVDTVIDRTVMAPRQIFTHDDLMKL